MTRRSFPAIHSGRLERWIGTERIEHLSTSMRGWYGRPIALLDVPGDVTRGAHFFGSLNFT